MYEALLSFGMVWALFIMAALFGALLEYSSAKEDEEHG